MSTESQQQIAREAWSQLDRATLTHHNLDGDKSEQGVNIILSAIERAMIQMLREYQGRCMICGAKPEEPPQVAPDVRETTAQPQNEND